MTTSSTLPMSPLPSLHRRYFAASTTRIAWLTPGLAASSSNVLPYLLQRLPVPTMDLEIRCDYQLTFDLPCGSALCLLYSAMSMALHKRKGGVHDHDLSDDFRLSSPATKIRRLDAELPPKPIAQEPNQERALVLFKPLLPSPSSSFSLSLHSPLISQIHIRNNQYLWSEQCDRVSVTGSGSCEEDNINDELALVPWVSSPSYQFSAADNTDTELMEADEIGEDVGSVMMDIEQQNEAKTSTSTSTIHYPVTHAGITEGIQQHCLLPQFSHNTSTPITWTR
ncbi:hypothetical protein VNO78_10219 [Psophocarpus tetragonolobus]|uniref:Uncharacterized protein n=1 Tax=Psophocarpus tetragonolobus TaxID=3891 RepID=A0AAN9SJH0_PSOTE